MLYLPTILYGINNSLRNMIERIQIQNYKSIQYADIKLGNLNVLIGSNGVGKSNFISFFELVNALLNKRLGSYYLNGEGLKDSSIKDRSILSIWEVLSILLIQTLSISN